MIPAELARTLLAIRIGDGIGKPSASFKARSMSSRNIGTHLGHVLGLLFPFRFLHRFGLFVLRILLSGCTL
jgi:hypothetical protein